MTTEQLDSLAQQLAANLPTLIGDLRDEILEAARVAVETANDEEKESAKLTLSHSISIDLLKETYEDSLAVSIRHKLKTIGRLEDPNQPNLPFTE